MVDWLFALAVVIAILFAAWRIQRCVEKTVRTAADEARVRHYEWLEQAKQAKQQRQAIVDVLQSVQRELKRPERQREQDYDTVLRLRQEANRTTVDDQLRSINHLEALEQRLHGEDDGD